MTQPTSTLDPTVERQRALRAVREAVGLVITTGLVGMSFIAPLVVVLASSIPQVVAALPEPARRVTLVLDGLPGLGDEPTEGADGIDGDELSEDAALEPDAGDDDALAGAAAEEEAPVEAVVKPKPEPEPEAEAEAEPTPAPPPEPEPEPVPEPEDGPTEKVPADRPDAAEGAPADVSIADGDAGKLTRKQRAAARCSETHPDITQVDASTWQVRKSLITYYTSSIEHLNTLGYSRKYEEEGVKGWLVGGFGCMSPLWKGGLRAQDVVQEVNGKKTNNVVQLFGLWVSQRNKKTFDIVLLRKGKPVTLHYQVI